MNMERMFAIFSVLFCGMMSPYPTWREGGKEGRRDQNEMRIQAKEGNGSRGGREVHLSYSMGMKGGTNTVSPPTCLMRKYIYMCHLYMILLTVVMVVKAQYIAAT